MCLDSPPMSVGGGKSGSPNGDEGSPPQSPADRALLEVSSPQANLAFRKRLRKIKISMKKHLTQMTLMRRDLRSCKAKMSEQQKQIVEYANRFDDYDKKNEETSRKFSTLLQVFTKVYLTYRDVDGRTKVKFYCR